MGKIFPRRKRGSRRIFRFMDAAGKLSTENSRPRTCFCRPALYGEIAVISPTGLLVEPDAAVPDLDARTGEQAVQALHERPAASTNAVMDGPKFLANVVARMLEGGVLAHR